ncbi:hypothetical protein [Nitrosomonas sp. Nm166]|uniref:hypothetical protein n=1 Tax=Nitrosomonas sp. Nm166 TaxID=1881054 RepID=UPI0008DF806F|nr:hypothetical protein [Nitrosomonas sp. Nm166]SFE92401.1 hypothetical protein SAMN05428977_103629 [Nitrosomonas sp. Nm166]
MVNANHSTQIDKDDNSKDSSTTVVPQTGKRPGDARGDPQQQKRNREEMNVGEDHRTEKMREEKRGTFP